ncbi:hypothetical protein [Nocardia donostiensis]|uniref:Uncharacterized protein n=1 Tax=Nocardia donostiensis TaxID=1538463 RepID=A0A1W0B3D3_9NOCA|nr:hypothetical protein [Nocardia donostiensis]ONM47355.1 hypothetical protein B0T46_18585 [Nocardia donostiensis]OQS16926.1 hypothetical protein B0T36_02540 [Nocardia donostiensis]OQS21134.1 hypothetical protein B0T44_08515 [Nocardia donostiensis]
MDLIAIEGRVAAERRAAMDRSPENELQLASSLYELAGALLATRENRSGRDRSAGALEPAQEAVMIRLRWLTAGHVSARFAGEVQDALKLLEQAARTIGHRELATSTIRDACNAYTRVAHSHPHAAGVCADGLSKCGVWLCRLDPGAAVAATDEAVRIRAALFAADPDQSKKYLATLNTLLRTLMVGRQRKQALAMYRERYAALTTPAMTARLRELGIEEIGFTNKTYTALAKLKVRSLERAGYLTQQQILYQSGGDLSTIEEINWSLALVGLKPLAAGAMPDPPARPVEIATSFGALSVHCSSPNAVEQVREAVIAAYVADGARPVSLSTFQGVDKAHWGTPEPQMNTAPRLGDDIVLIERLSGSWIAVRSLKWELTPVAKNPLALYLSRHWPVVSVTTIENMAYELCWYEQGAATQYAALGRPAEPTPLDTPLAPLNFGKLADYGADYASETQVRAAFGNTTMFAKLTQLPASGIRQAAEAQPLSSYGDQILSFRR